MTCSKCRRDNAANRRYCGGCGVGLISTCTACGFPNAVDDRYCGGCGCTTGAAHARVEAPKPAEASSELDGLFERPVATTTPTALPQTGIGQEDLDRLFGVGA